MVGKEQGSAERLQTAGGGQSARARLWACEALEGAPPAAFCRWHMEEVVARVVLVQNGEGLEEVLEVPRRGKG
jgi:hypothetical protein